MQLGKLLSEGTTPTSSVAGQRAPQSSALLAAEQMPSLAPSLNLLLGGSLYSHQNADVEPPQLPNKLEAEALFQRYTEAVSPLAHVLHLPSFKRVASRRASRSKNFSASDRAERGAARDFRVSSVRQNEVLKVLTRHFEPRP